jgi:hypothetical protein
MKHVGEEWHEPRITRMPRSLAALLAIFAM